MPGGDEDPPTGPVDGDDVESPSGLGRGLAAIIPTLADLDAPAPTPKRRRRRSGAEAVLGAVADSPNPPAPADDEATPAPEPGAVESTHVPAASAVRQLRDDLVGALLDGLANTMAIDELPGAALDEVSHVSVSSSISWPRSFGDMSTRGHDRADVGLHGVVHPEEVHGHLMVG